MRKKAIGQVDLRTGEVLGGFVAYVVPKNKNGFGERWFAMAQGAALDALINFNRVEDFRVLMSLLKRLDYENMIIANQADIARDLHMKPSNVSSAIKRLVHAGAIIRGPKVGVSSSFKLNPNFGWKGSAKNHVQALDEYRQERLKAAGITEVLEGGEPKEST